LYDTVGLPGTSGHQAARTNLDAISSADGTSNTLVFSEINSVLAPQRQWNINAPTPVTGSGERFLLTTVPEFVLVPAFGIASGTFSQSEKIINSIASTNPSYNAHPSSNHPGGVGATMCDGRTTFLRDTIAHHVYAQLLTSDSRWVSGGYAADLVSPRMRQWLLNVPSGLPIPYVLQESDL
jgi:hypothetical protein